jgi:PAS domain S-box-containing protein
LQELKTKSVAEGVQAEGRSVRIFLQSTFYTVSGSWQWEMATDAVFCSDVMLSLPLDFAGTRSIFHPDDVAAVIEKLCSQQSITHLAFRIITTYGEVKTLVGENLVVTEEEQEPEALQHQAIASLIQEVEEKAANSHLLLLREIFEKTERFSGAGTWYFNATTHQTWYSDHVFRLHDLPAQSLNAHLHTFHPFIHPEDRDLVVEFTDRAVREKKPLYIEYRILVTGSEKWLSYKTMWFYSEKGEDILSGVFQDVTEQKAAAKEIADYKNLVQFQRQQALYDEQQVGFGHWQVNLITRKTTYSDQYYRIFGLKPHSLAPTIISFLNYVHPDDRDGVEAAYKKIIYEHAVPDLEFRILRSDGKIRYVLQKAKLLMYEQEIIVSGIIQDITVQRMLETKVGDLHQSLQQKAWLMQQNDEVGNTVSWVMDLEEKTIEWSESFYKLLGYAKVPPSNITEKSLFSVIHPHDLKAFRRLWDDAVQEKQAAAFHFRALQRGTVRYIRAVFSFQTLQDKAYFVGTLQDTTGEEELQQQLSQRVQLAESLTENIRDRVIITDSHYNILLWNKACEAAYDRKKADAIGQNFFDVFPHLKTEAHVQLFQRVHRGEKVVQEGHSSALGNGYYNLYLVPLYQAEEVTGILHVINDVTRETELRNNLNERLQLIENIVQSSVDRIIALDRNMNYLYWNKKAEEFYGQTRESVVGKNILEVFPRLVNDPTYAELRRALRGETVHLPVDADKENYSETYLVPIKGEGEEVFSVLWIAHDLTREYELFKEQQKAAEIVNTIHAAFIELDNEFRFRFVNDLAAEYLGKSFSELSGKVMWDLLPEAVDTAGYHAIVKANTEKVKTSVEYFSAVYKRWVYMSVAPLENGVLLFQYDRQEIREAELRLKESEALLKEAEQVAHTGSYEADLLNNTFRFSDGLYRLFGEEHGAFVPSLEWIDAHSHPDDIEKVSTILNQAAADKKPYHYTRRIYRKDGELRILEAHGKVVTDAASNAVKFIGLVQDITERKNAEEQLKGKAHYLQRITETTPDMLSIAELESMTFTFLNEETFRTHGFNPVEIVAKKDSREWQLIHPDDKEEVARYFKRFHLASDDDTITAEYRARSKGGEWKWFSVRGKVFQRNENKVTHVLNAIENITERKRAEEELLRLKEEVAQKATDKYYTLFNAIDEGFYRCEVIFDENGEPVDILYLEENPAAVHIIGESFVGRRLKEINPAYEAYWFAIWGSVALSGESKRMEQYSAPDNKWFDFHISKFGDDRSREVVIVFQDITERKEEERRQQYLIQLSDTIRALLDPEEVQFQVVSLLGQYLGVGRAFFCEVEPDGDHMWIRRGYTDGVESLAGFFRISDFGPFLLDAYQTGQTVVIEDAATDPRLSEKERAAYLSVNVRTCVCVPLLKNNRLYSVLTVNHLTPRKWRAQDVSLIQETAERTWPAVERAKAEDALRKSEAQLAAVFEALPVGIGFIDNNGQIILSNEVMRRFLPGSLIPSRDDERHQRWLAYHPEGHRLARQDFPGARALRGETVVPGIEMLYTEDDGNQVWTRVAAVPIKDEEGVIIGYVAVVTDITLLKEAEEQLRDFTLMLEQQVAERTRDLEESKRFVEQVMDASPDFIMVFNLLTNKNEFVSKAAYRGDEERYRETLQIDYEAILARAHPDDREVLHRFIDSFRTAPDGVIHEVEYRVVKEKEVIWYRSRGKVFRRDGEGRATHYISVVQDITERKKTEAELQKNFTILQNAEELAQIGSWEYEIATDTLNWSEGMYRLFGLPQGIKVKPETYLDFAMEEDRSAAKRIIKNLKKNHQPFEELVRIQRKDGVRLLKLKASVEHDEQGKARRVVGVDVDITDIREAEQKMAETRNLLELTAVASPDAITIYDLVKKQPYFLNNCLAEWVGINNEALLSMGIEGRLNLIHTDDRLRILHFNEKMKAAKDGELLSIEYRIHGRDDKLLWIRNRCKVFQRNAAGNVTHILSVLQDVTEAKASERVQKSLNASLEKKNQELAIANEEITSFAFVASHDLKEPLRKIHTFSDWLLNKEANLSEDGRQAVEKIDNSVKRLSLLVQDILTLTKVHVDHEGLKPVDLNSLMDQVKTELQARWPNAVMEAGPLPTILGTASQLFYLLKNLVSNGLKFQEENTTPHIAIGASREDNFLKLSIRDNGIGIPPEYHKRIFEIFRRLHGRTEYEGTGIGLTICKKIMEKHGGKITVESEPGKGSTFTCWFPLALCTSENVSSPVQS